MDVSLLLLPCMISNIYPSTGVSDRNMLNFSPIPNIACTPAPGYSSAILSDLEPAERDTVDGSAITTTMKTMMMITMIIL